MELDIEPRDTVSRDIVIAALRAEGIPAAAMNPPIYRLPAFWDGPVHSPGMSLDQLAETCPHSEHLGSWAISLPHWALLGDHHDIQDIADGLAKVLNAFT